MFQFEGTYLSSISGSGDLVALKIFLLHLVFNLICINYANYNVKIDLIISKEIDQARTFLFYNLAVFMFSFHLFFNMCLRARGKQMNPTVNTCHSQRKRLQEVD